MGEMAKERRPMMPGGGARPSVGGARLRNGLKAPQGKSLALGRGSAVNRTCTRCH
jgi:hypothetical protein